MNRTTGIVHGPASVIAPDRDVLIEGPDESLLPAWIDTPWESFCNCNGLNDHATMVHTEHSKIRKAAILPLDASMLSRGAVLDFRQRY